MRYLGEEMQKRMLARRARADDEGMIMVIVPGLIIALIVFLV